MRLTSAPVSAQAPTTVAEEPNLTGNQVKGDLRGGRGFDVRLSAEGSAAVICAYLTVINSKYR